MFTAADGPTALRAELVRALCFSLSLERISEPGFEGDCCAAISAVWNGKKGYVAILVRQAEPPLLRRYVTAHSCRSESALRETLDKAVDFLEDMGLSMDSYEFEGLSSAERDNRLEEWNALRKLNRSPRCFGTVESAAAPAPVDRPEPEPERTPEEGDAGKSVLGRLALVQKGSERLDPIARLLSYL